MKRQYIFRFFTVTAMIVLASACSKTMPEPEVAEPEPIKTTPASEGSLWPGQTPGNSLFSDRKAARIGDIITVYLVEETTATNKADTKTSRDSAYRLGFSTDPAATGTQFDFSGYRKFTGKGDTSRSDKLVSTISALVLEVLPNGNLRIDGRRKLKINNGDQYIRVMGLVRQEDINYDNTVLSTKLANASITYDGVGDLDKSQQGGWLAKTLDKIWPF